jgi:hypothetical protein
MYSTEEKKRGKGYQASAGGAEENEDTDKIRGFTPLVFSAFLVYCHRDLNETTEEAAISRPLERWPGPFELRSITRALGEYDAHTRCVCAQASGFRFIDGAPSGLGHPPGQACRRVLWIRSHRQRGWSRAFSLFRHEQPSLQGNQERFSSS